MVAVYTPRHEVPLKHWAAMHAWHCTSWRPDVSWQMWKVQRLAGVARESHRLARLNTLHCFITS
jgi:hypothetical protein